jgi:hypothetical protein
MTQAPVALSDFTLALEAALFAGLINPARRIGGLRTVRPGCRNQALIRSFELFFYAIAAASLIGGAVHGFVLNPTTAAARTLWPATMIAVGAAACAGWRIGSNILLPSDRARVVGRAATIEFLIYSGAVILGMRSYRAAIFNYLPAALFLLLVFVLAYVRRINPSAVTPTNAASAATGHFDSASSGNQARSNAASRDAESQRYPDSAHAGNRHSSYLLGALAMVTTLVAAGLQQSKLAIDALGLTHNVLYHLVQGVGLLMLFLSARHLVYLPSQPAIGAVRR